VVGVVQGYKTLRVACRLEDLRCIVDVHRAIQRRMEDEEGLSQRANALPLIVLAQIIDE
jgi:hypothetical protein